jgi:hypothetical protein
MTSATFQMTFDSLPRNAQNEVMNFVEFLAQKYSTLSVKRRKKEQFVPNEKFTKYICEVKEDIKHNRNLSPAMNINEALCYLEKL